MVSAQTIQPYIFINKLKTKKMNGITKLIAFFILILSLLIMSLMQFITIGEQLIANLIAIKWFIEELRND